MQTGFAQGTVSVGAGLSMVWGSYEIMVCSSCLSCSCGVRVLRFCMQMVAAQSLTGSVVPDAVKHLGTGSCHQLPGAAPGPAGTNAIDGGFTVDSRAWNIETEASDTLSPL